MSVTKISYNVSCIKSKSMRHENNNNNNNEKQMIESQKKKIDNRNRPGDDSNIRVT